MPLWRIYHPPGTFNAPEERQGLSQAITEIYTKVPLPKFYVVVLFQPLDEYGTYVGGEHRSLQGKAVPFIRVEIHNIARRLPDGNNDRKYGFLNRVDEALKPYIQDKGWDWEYHVLETDRSLWKINGMVPPESESEHEKKWIEDNRPSTYKGAFAGHPNEDELNAEQEEKDKDNQAKAEREKKAQAEKEKQEKKEG